MLRASFHGIAQLAYACETDLNLVAILQVNWRVHKNADARRRAGADNVAGPQRQVLRDEFNELRYLEDQVAGVGLLPQLAVDAQFDVERVRVAKLIVSDKPRAARREGIQPLCARP